MLWAIHSESYPEPWKWALRDHRDHTAYFESHARKLGLRSILDYERGRDTKVTKDEQKKPSVVEPARSLFLDTEATLGGLVSRYINPVLRGFRIPINLVF